MLLKALQSDLKEFYSTLKEDTAKIPLPKSELTNDVREFYTDMFCDTANTAKHVTRNTINMLDNLDGHMFTLVSATPDDWTDEDAVQEAQARNEMIEVYTTPLPSLESIDEERVCNDAEYAYEISEIRAYMKTFDINQMQDKINIILQDRTSIVKQMYEELVVPTIVSEEDFWMRYYYRCDPERIIRFWTFHDELVHHRRELMKQNVQNTKQNITLKVTTTLKSSNKVWKSLPKILYSIKETDSTTTTTTTTVDQSTEEYYEESKEESKVDEESELINIDVEVKKKKKNEVIVVVENNNNNNNNANATPTATNNTNTDKVLAIRQKLEEAKRRMAEAEEKIKSLREGIDTTSSLIAGKKKITISSSSVSSVSVSSIPSATSSNTDVSSLGDYDGINNNNTDNNDDFSSITSFSTVDQSSTPLASNNNNNTNNNSFACYLEGVKSVFITNDTAPSF